MRQARAGHDTCGQRVTPRCRWARARPGFEATRRAKLAARTAHGRVATHRHTQRPGTTGVEGAGGPVGLAAVPVGGGRAWPDNEPTRRAKLAARTDRGRVATHRHTQRPGTTGAEGAGGSGGHGRASRSTTPSRRLACGDLAGGRARRRPEHQRSRKQQAQSQIPAAAAVGGGGAWLRRPWAAAGPGRASSRRTEPHISDQAPPVWRAPEGPEGTGGLRGAAPNEVRPPSLAGGRALRRPEHQRGNSTAGDQAC